ncbi:MAG: hypothetical protein ACFNUH_09230 [Bacteroidota bacterium]
MSVYKHFAFAEYGKILPHGRSGYGCRINSVRVSGRKLNVIVT